MKFNFLDLLLPREIKYYDYFKQQSVNLYEACVAFRKTMENIQDLNPEELKRQLACIKDYEKKGDAFERHIIEELHKSFITPIDREDIHVVVINMEKAMDMLNNLSRKIEIFGIKEVPNHVVKFCTIMVDIAKELTYLMKALRTRQGAVEIIRIMHTQEKLGDEAFHQGMAELFNGKNSPVYIIQFKEIYELLEGVIDAIDYVGKIIRGILVKLG